MKKTYLSHIDLDGIGVVILIKYFKLEYDELLVLDYDFEQNEDIIEKIENHDEIYFIDLSPSEIYYNRLITLGKKVHIIDHHDSSKWCEDKENVIHCLDQCGTKLFFNYLTKRKRINPIVREFVELVNTYDLFNKNSELWEKAKDLNHILWYTRDRNKKGIELYIPFIESVLSRLERDVSWRFTGWENNIIAYERQREFEIYERVLRDMEIRKDSRGNQFGLVCMASKISPVCDRILHKRLDLSYIIVVNSYKQITGKLSCRSREDFDTRQIGGFEGHPPASGWIIDRDFALYLLDNKVSFKYKEDIVDSEIFDKLEE